MNSKMNATKKNEFQKSIKQKGKKKGVIDII
jgi:hypothetical protein